MTLRVERKLQTRHTLMDAALKLLDEGRSFASLSLREVTREAGIVPTAFYRHFESMDDLGLALVESTISTLRQLVRGARQHLQTGNMIISASVKVFLEFVSLNHREFGFAVRERFGGSAVIRHAIAREIHVFSQDLAADLLRFPLFNQMRRQDVDMVAGFLVTSVANAAGEWLEIDPQDELLRVAYREALVKQLRLLLLGAMAWRPTPT